MTPPDESQPVDVRAVQDAPRPVTFDAGDVTLRGDHHGAARSGARHIVLLHGGGQTRHSWGSTANELAAVGWNATTVDLRGHGDSDWSPTGRYGLADLRSDVATIARVVGPPVTLIGASLGGLTSLSVAAHHPELVDALILADIVPRTVPAGVARIHAFMSGHPRGFARLEDVALAIAEYKRQPPRLNPDGLRNVVRQRPDGRWYWHWDPRVIDARRRDGVNPGVQADDLLRQARTITVPTLIVHGTRSDVVDDDGIAELLAAIPGSTSAEIAGAGHMIAGDANDTFTSAVTRFLSNLEH